MGKNAAALDYDHEVIKNYNQLKKTEKEKRALYNFIITKDIRFSDMVWDFNFQNINNRIKNKYRFDFSKIPDPYIFYVKAAVLNEILIKDNSFGAIKKSFENLRAITKQLFENNIKDVSIISKKTVMQVMDKYLKNNQLSYVEKIGIKFIEILNTIEDVEGYNFEEEILYLREINKNCYKSKPIKAVNDYIPDKFLNQITSLALKDIDDTSLKTDDRIFACLLIIMAETGMRSEEVSLLETNKLDITPNKKLHFLHFLTFKTHGNKKEGKSTYTWLTDKALKAYNTCEKLVDEIIDSLGENSKLRLLIHLNTGEEFNKRVSILKLRKRVSQIDKDTLIQLDKESRRYLFISAKTGIQKKGNAVIRENLEKFFIRHESDFNIEIIPINQRDSIKELTIKSKSKYEKYFSLEQRKNLTFEQVLTKIYPFVNPHMFRVTVCTKLFKKGVHIDFIIKHMNHLSEDMTVYYNKSEQFRDQLEDGIKILQSVSNKEGLVEADSNKVEDEFFRTELSNRSSRENIERINIFLQKNKLNIREDFKKIVKILKETNSPIIENDFGICIRTVIHGICEKRKYFSSMSDNYFIGIQLNTYRYLHFSYERFKQKYEIVQHNKKIAKNDSRYMLEYEREEKALRNFVSKTLFAEIDLVEKDINENGVQSVIEKYPVLEPVISKLDKIKEEIKEWTI